MPDKLDISKDWPALPGNPNALNFETSRLRTFHGWNYDVSALQLAKDGFSATGQDDEVHCFSCKRTHRGWTRGQDPHFVHSRLSPHCPMVSGTASRAPVNIPIPVRNPASVILTNTLENFRNLVGRSGIQELGNVAPDCHVNTILGVHLRNQPMVRQEDRGIVHHRNGNISFTAQPDSGSTRQQAYAELSSNLRRQESFTDFPTQHSHLVQELVRLGFFYVGHSDIVLCHSCGLGLRNWQRGDDPKIAHVRWRRSCLHLQDVISPAFIQRAREEMDIIGAAN